jgi:alkylhydroperoxidase/carboxymuconolactone decarboxylase family protein YurZ
MKKGRKEAKKGQKRARQKRKMQRRAFPKAANPTRKKKTRSIVSQSRQWLALALLFATKNLYSYARIYTHSKPPQKNYVRYTVNPFFIGAAFPQDAAT